MSLSQQILDNWCGFTDTQGSKKEGCPPLTRECGVVYIFSLNTFQDCQSAFCLGSWFNIIKNMSVLSVLCMLDCLHVKQI